MESQGNEESSSETTSSTLVEENNEDDIEAVASMSMKDALDLNHMEIASNIIIPISSSRASSSNDCTAHCSHHGIPTPPLQLPVTEIVLLEDQEEEEEEEEGSVQDLRPFDCSYCHKSFGNSGDCKRHERLHMGRPSLFQCSFCPRFFAQLVSKVFHEIRCPAQKTRAAKVKSLIRKKRLKSLKIQPKSKSQSKSQPQSHRQLEPIIPVQIQENNNDSSDSDEDSSSSSSNSSSNSSSSDMSDDCEIVDEISYENEPEVDNEPIIPSTSISVIQNNYQNSHAVVSSRHPSLKPVKEISGHECMYCKKLFPTNSRLGVHIRVHTGERPFACRYCDRKFTQSGHCRSHQLIHLRDASYRGSNKSTNAQPKNDTQVKTNSSKQKGRESHVQKGKNDDGTKIENVRKFKKSIKRARNFKGDLVEDDEAESCKDTESSDSSSSGTEEEIKPTSPSNSDEEEENKEKDAPAEKDRPKLSNGLKKDSQKQTCPFCSKSFVYTSSLKKHLHAHKNSGKKFKSRASSTRQRSTSNEEEQEEEDRIKCKFCDKRFRRSYMRNAHEQILHHEILASMTEQPPQQQQQSQRTSSSRLAASTSSSSTNSEASASSSSFSSINPRSRNKGRTKPDEVIPSHLCIYCNRLFNSVISLRLHERVHRDEFPFKCNVPGCQKIFKTFSLLKIHEQIHSEVQSSSSSSSSFKCSWADCHKSFETSSLLRKHQQTHVDHGLFVCDCGEFFTQFSQLQRHERVTHV